MYGFIGTSFYSDDAIVISDDIMVDETKDGRPNRRSVKKAYATVVKQLKKRYREWIKDNIFE